MIVFLPTPGLVISVAAASPHDVYDNPIRLSAAVSQTPKLFFFAVRDTVVTLLNVLIASLCS